MRTIYKYQIDPEMPMPVTFTLPSDAIVVHVATEKTGSVEERVSLWIEHDLDSPREERTFTLVGTGHNIPAGATYVGTAIMPPFVLHVYEETS